MSDNKEWIAERLLQWIPKRTDAYKMADEICAKFTPAVVPTVSELKAVVNNVFCKQQLGEISYESDMQTEIAKAISDLIAGGKK